MEDSPERASVTSAALGMIPKRAPTPTVHDNKLVLPRWGGCAC